jgi:hypothetical protein
MDSSSFNSTLSSFQEIPNEEETLIGDDKRRTIQKRTTEMFTMRRARRSGFGSHPFETCKTILSKMVSHRLNNDEFSDVSSKYGARNWIRHRIF